MELRDKILAREVFGHHHEDAEHTDARIFFGRAKFAVCDIESTSIFIGTSGDVSACCTVVTITEAIVSLTVSAHSSIIFRRSV